MGEHELDYIDAGRRAQRHPSPEEVRDTEWVARDHLQDFKGSEGPGAGITPWSDFAQGAISLLVEES